MSGFNERLSQRQRMFKKALAPDEALCKREAITVTLRKQARENTLQKKRLIMNSSTLPMHQSMELVTDDNLTHLEHLLSSDSTEDQLNAVIQLNAILSSEMEAPIQEVIDIGAVPKLMQFMWDANSPQLQYEAARVVCNIVSGTTEQTAVVVQEGVLPLFVHWLECSEELCEQAVWALGNIAGDSVPFRDLVLESGALNSIVDVLLYTQNQTIVRSAAWALSNICRGKPLIPLESAVRALDCLSVLIFCNDAEVLSHVCWALAYLTDSSAEYIDAVIQSNVTAQLVELLLSDSVSVQLPALEVIGNIAAGSEHHRDLLLQRLALPALCSLLCHADKKIRRSACCAIANIASGTHSQIQEIIDGGLIPQLIGILECGDFDLKRDALYALSNMTARACNEQIDEIVRQGFLERLCDLLPTPDMDCAGVALECLDRILMVGLQRRIEEDLEENEFGCIVEQTGGLDKLESLQECPNEDVYQKAMQILEYYFTLEEEDIDMDGVKSSDAFEFGASPPAGGFVFT